VDITLNTLETVVIKPVSSDLTSIDGMTC